MRCGGFKMRVAVVLCVIVVSTAWSAERVIYVDAAATGAGDGLSWANAYRDLQDALADANEAPPAVIHVAQGTYSPGPATGATRESRDATFQLYNYVTLEGGYAGVARPDPNMRDVDRHLTILSGDLAGNDGPEENWDVPARQDNCRRVVTATGTDETAVMDGFTVTGAREYGMWMQPGSPSIHRCRFVDNGITGLYAWDCNSVVAECMFERNGHLVSWGGFWIGHGDLTLTDCAFVENQGGGLQSGGTLNLIRCSFIANEAFSTAGIRHSGDLTARQCIFRSNRGEAVECLGATTLVDCEFVDNVSRGGAGAVHASNRLSLTGCKFIGNSGYHVMDGGAVAMYGDVLEAEGCVFAGNSGHNGPGAIFTHSTAVVRLSNCTFIDNRGWPNAIEHPPIEQSLVELSHCIIWNGPEPFRKFESFEPGIVVTHSDVQGGYEGEGNIDVDPLFVDPGYWDPNGTPDDPNDDVYVAGDYHLKSQAGHWDCATESWVFDEVTSPCVDAGDPNAPLGAESFPNGGYVNLGAYGGTPEASRSYFGEPVCETHIAGDINGDCKVDDLDMDILVSHWLMPDIAKPNIPPTIRLISPAEGDAFAEGTPMTFRAEASDPDGRVVRVQYTVTSQGEGGSGATGPGLGDPDDEWMVTWEWWPSLRIYPDRTYTVRAKAIDDQGAVTTTPEVEIRILE